MMHIRNTIDGRFHRIYFPLLRHLAAAEATREYLPTILLYTEKEISITIIQVIAKQLDFSCKRRNEGCIIEIHFDQLPYSYFRERNEVRFWINREGQGRLN